MNYFRLVADDDSRWHLQLANTFPNGEELDVWAFRKGVRYSGLQPVPLMVQREGKHVDYVPTAFGSEIVSKRMANIIDETAPDEVQRIPTVIPAEGSWELINPLHVIDCIDHDQSDIQYYPPEHPRLAGNPRMVVRLVIDRNRTSGHDLFMPKGWRVATIVSERLKMALQEAGVSGIDYWPVSAED